MLFRYNPIQAQAYKANFYKELEGLKLHHGMSPFNTIRYHLFLTIAEMINHGTNPIPQALLHRVRESGEALNRLGGMTDMTDNLIWSFIPRSLHRQIEACWNGVGQFKA